MFLQTYTFAGNKWGNSYRSLFGEPTGSFNTTNTNVTWTLELRKQGRENIMHVI
jgi:hypothetical protein